MKAAVGLELGDLMSMPKMESALPERGDGIQGIVCVDELDG